jgi:L-2-hydroxyglutarate oxidase LhgO
MEYFLDSAKDKGAMVAYNSEATAIEKVSAGYKVSVQNSSEVCVLKTKFLINCAGLDSDSIAAMAGIDIKRFGYELHYCKGQYFRVNSRKSGLIKRLIYPVPEAKSGGLGIHATLDLGGSLRLGPDDEYLKGRDKDYSVNDSKRHDFYVSARRLLPFLEEEDLSSDTSGIRPKLQGPEEDFRDFIIDEESDKGFPGLINLIGIESPGLTSSPAIARLVKNLIGGGG